MRGSVTPKTRRPSRGGRRTLSLEDVREIRIEHALGTPAKVIARRFPQVCLGTVRDVCKRKTWRKEEHAGFEAELFERRTRR